MKHSTHSIKYEDKYEDGAVKTMLTKPIPATKLILQQHVSNSVVDELFDNLGGNLGDLFRDGH